MQKTVQALVEQKMVCNPIKRKKTGIISKNTTRNSIHSHKRKKRRKGRNNARSGIVFFVKLKV